MSRIFSISYFLILFSAGCSSAVKHYDHMESPEYRRRPQLRQSLVTGTEPMSEAVVQKILSSKVAFPKSVNLAVVRLTDSNEELSFQMIDKDISEKFYDLSNWGNRVKSLTPVPQMILPKAPSLTNLRQAAVLLQADALLIIKPLSYSDWKFEWFKDDKAKGITSLEIVLLDVRTGVVPYTSLITESVEVTKAKSDYSYDELLARAKQESETQALLQVAAAVKAFISRAM